MPNDKPVVKFCFRCGKEVELTKDRRCPKCKQILAELKEVIGDNEDVEEIND